MRPLDGSSFTLVAPGRGRLGEAGWEAALSAGRALVIDAAAIEAWAVPKPVAAVSDSIAPDAVRELGLTRREVEVLRLIAEGLTDREIADRLFISHRTASKHVSGAIAKLGVPCDHPWNCCTGQCNAGFCSPFA